MIMEIERKRGGDWIPLMAVNELIDAFVSQVVEHRGGIDLSRNDEGRVSIGEKLFPWPSIRKITH
jgi:hypothetical protein